jgi:hypothetical protein
LSDKMQSCPTKSNLVQQNAFSVRQNAIWSDKMHISQTK